MLNIVFLTVLLSSSQAFTATSDKDGLIFGGFDNQSIVERNQIASDLLIEINKLHNYLPTQKLSEIRWIHKEDAALKKLTGDAWSSRIVNLSISPEFQHYELSSALKSLIEALECASNSNTSIKKEMLCWSVASFYMSDEEIFDDSVNILINSGRLPKKAIGEVTNSRSFYLSLFIYGLQLSL